MRYVIRIVVGMVLLCLIASAAFAGTITVCQCNIYGGGRWTDQDQTVVTYDTARRFAEWVATINPPGSANPPIAVIGMQEVIADSDRSVMENYLEQKTGVNWDSMRVAQGINGASGIGIFWRPDLVETRPEWYLGEKTVERIDSGYLVKFTGRLFKKVGVDEAFGLFSGKLMWDGDYVNGQLVNEEIRRQEAVRLKDWIRSGETGSPGMSGFPGTVRVITTDLNSDTGTATYNEMNLEYADPSTQHTASSFDSFMDIWGRKIDYIWWDYDAYAERTGGFVTNPARSPHVGSDHRSLYATINLHTVDLTPPAVTITSPANGATVSGTVPVSATASDASGVLQVQFSIDGVSVWTDTALPYEFSWNTSSYARGYHTISAIATDGSTNRLIGQSYPATVWVGSNPPTIADAKAQQDGQVVAVSGKVVTASFGSYFYIEEPNRSTGIKVTNATAPGLGTRVNVVGKMNSLNYEREISATSVVTDGALPALEPLGMTNDSLGGSGLGNYTRGVQGGQGGHNLGLLISCWGKITKNVEPYYIYINDGSNLNDGYGYPGVRVDISSLSGWNPPAEGKYIRITGISTTWSNAGKLQRKIKVRSASDIREL